MKTFAKGWNIHKCILTPQEAQTAFAGLHHVNFQSRVPASYVESDPQEFFGRYTEFYRLLAQGYEFRPKLDNKYFTWPTGLSNDLSKCTYTRVFQDATSGQWFKTSTFSEPCVGVSPFLLLFPKADQKLHTNFHYGQFPQFTVGLQLEYPQLFTYGKKGEPVKTPTETGEVYKTIVKRIKALSKGLVFTKGEAVYRPRVTIGNTARHDFASFYFAKHYGCELV